jgi:predicted ferric reductase
LVWVVLLFLFLVPCVLTILNYRPSLSIRSMSFLLGRLTGIIGLSSLTLTVVLSAKFSFLEDLFGGLDKVYQVHQSIGKMAFYNMLAHPLLLLVKYLPDDYLLALEYLFIGDDLSINFGVVAFWGFLILIIMTLAMKLKYHIWKISHGWMMVLFLPLFLHAYAVHETIVSDGVFPGYLFYLVLLILLVTFSWLYSLWPRRKHYKVLSIRRTKNLQDFKLRAIGKGIKYNPGQFALVRFPRLGREFHPFSIASIGVDLRFIVKSLGDYTSKMDSIQIGDSVFVEGAYGRFNQESVAPQVWIAGGIGVTPFLGMMQTTMANVHLYYAVKERSDLVDLPEQSNVHTQIKVEAEEGRLTIEDIEWNKKDEFYLCGPQGMKEYFIRELKLRGIKKNKIHSEDFQFK